MTIEKKVKELYTIIGDLTEYLTSVFFIDILLTGKHSSGCFFLLLGGGE